MMNTQPMIAKNIQHTVNIPYYVAQKRKPWRFARHAFMNHEKPAGPGTVDTIHVSVRIETNMLSE